jgi:hypothetical protein
LIWDFLSSLNNNIIAPSPKINKQPFHNRPKLSKGKEQGCSGDSWAITKIDHGYLFKLLFYVELVWIISFHMLWWSILLSFINHAKPRKTPDMPTNQTIAQLIRTWYSYEMMPCWLNHRHIMMSWDVRFSCNRFLISWFSDQSW